MVDLLFNPQGRILKRRFWQGLVILTVISVLLTALQGTTQLSRSVGGFMIFMVIGIAMLYMQVCVYGKRFHDAGTTAWWVIAVLIGELVLAFTASSLFGGIFLGPEAEAIAAEMAERRSELQIQLDGNAALSRMLLPLSLITTIVSAVIMGLIVGSLKTQPGQNKHGPVPGEEWQDF